ncbi:hypothetical protein V1227_39340 [Lentzea sp. DG1S-22]|nr:hypothetical protein [Lentzea sp. DG1S-22]WVH80968.1 hypothetical protein V1227_39340 [Lentzea sp. DG1S-22]
MTEIAGVLDDWDDRVSPATRTAAEAERARHRVLWESAHHVHPG